MHDPAVRTVARAGEAREARVRREQVDAAEAVAARVRGAALVRAHDARLARAGVVLGLVPRRARAQVLRDRADDVGDGDAVRVCGLERPDARHGQDHARGGRLERALAEREQIAARRVRGIEVVRGVRVIS